MPIHETYRYTVGVVIEGIGNDAATYSRGIAWAYGGDVSGTVYGWTPGALVKIPESIDTTVNPLSGDISTSAFDFEFNFSNTVAGALLSQQKRPQYVLGADAGRSGDITVHTITGVAKAGLSGDVIWVGDEAILLGTHSGSGVYAGNFRGRFLTDIASHAADTHVYTVNPYIRYRRVQVVLYDHDLATWRIIWRGFVDNVGTSSDGTRLVVSCIELIAALKDSTVNRDAKNLVELGGLNEAKDHGGGNVYVLSKGDYTMTARKSGTTPGHMWIQSGDTLITATYSAGSYVNYVGVPRLGSPSPDADDREEESWEVFVVEKDNSKSSTIGLTYPYHPVAIALALMTSTYRTDLSVSTTSWDGLGGAWGAGLALDAIDTASFTEAIADSVDLKIDQLILGWDGEPVDVVMTVIRVLLNPFGFYLGTNVEGRLNISKISTPDIEDIFTASSVAALPSTLKMDLARSNGVNQVIAMVGGTPWSDPVTITNNGSDGTVSDSFRQGIFGEKRSSEIDYQTMRKTSSVEQLSVERLAYAFFEAPRVTIRAPDWKVDTLDYDHGSYVEITSLVRDPWIVDADGVRVNSFDSTLIGTIVGRRLNLANMTYDLTLLLEAYRGGPAYWRAPSARVASVASAVVTLTANEFHDTDTDVERFTAGDEVYFVDAAGVNASGSATWSILSIGTNTATLDSAPVTVAGDIMRLADYDAYSNTAVISGGPANVWTYLADANRKLGSSSDDARIYG